MSHFTTPLGLTLANPGTGEPFSTAVVNGDFVLLDTAILADRVRLTALEGAGAIRPGSSGGADWPVTTLAALDALSLAKVGDIAYMSDPGSGNAGSATIDAMKWEAISGTGTALKWRASDVVVADTKAHLDTFIAALAGTDLQARVGELAYVIGTGVAYRFTSTAGAYRLQDDKVIVPTSIAGSGAVLDPLTGLITCTNVSTVAVNGCYASDGSGIDDYELVIVKTAASLNNTLQYRNRLAGTDAATLYDTVLIGSSAGAGAFVTTIAATLHQLNGGVAVIEDDLVRIKQPALAAPTMIQSTSFVTPNPATSPLSAMQIKGGMHDTAVAYDGFSITTTGGTFTGVMYLRRKK